MVEGSSGSIKFLPLGFRLLLEHPHYMTKVTEQGTIYETWEQFNSREHNSRHLGYVNLHLIACKTQMQSIWVPQFTPNLQKFTAIHTTFRAISKNVRNLQRKLPLPPPPPPPIISQLALRTPGDHQVVTRWAAPCHLATCQHVADCKCPECSLGSTALGAI